MKSYSYFTDEKFNPYYSDTLPESLPCLKRYHGGRCGGRMSVVGLNVYKCDKCKSEVTIIEVERG